MGTRLKSVVSEVPKPMAPINGTPFLEIQIKYWISQGIKKFILSVGYKKEIIINYFGSKFQNIDIKYVVEDIPLGTGGAILRAMAEYNINKPFLLLNGDTYFDIPLEELYNFHSTKNSNLTFSVFESSNTTRYLSLNVNSDMKIVSPNSTEQLNDNKYVNGGVYAIDPEIFHQIECEPNKHISLEAEIIPRLITNNMLLYAYKFNSKFIDIGIPEDYFKAQKIL